MLDARPKDPTITMRRGLDISAGACNEKIFPKYIETQPTWSSKEAL